MSNTNSRKTISLMGAGLDSGLAAKVVSKGFSLTSIKRAPRAILEEQFEEYEVKRLVNLKRKPIPQDVVKRLIEESHWKCCECWDYSRNDPIIIHHIEEHSRTQDDRYENLAVLCLNHHALAHSRWEISRHPLPPALIRYKKQQWIEAISDFVKGLRAAPGSEPRLPIHEREDSSNTWIEYLQQVEYQHRVYHIPNELRTLITWQTEPVSVSQCLRFVLIKYRPLLPDEKEVPRKQKQASTFTLSEVLTNKLLVLTGSAGAGKTTCLRYLCHFFSTQALQKLAENPTSKDINIPILITLKHFGSLDLFSLIHSQLRKNGVGINRDLLESYLDSIPIAFLLDGYDEVKPARRNDLVSEISTLGDLHPDSTIIITSRKRPKPQLFERFKEYEVQDLDSETIMKYAESYLGSDRYAFMYFIEQHQLEDFIKTPLLLTLSLILFRQDARSLDSLADIYSRVLKVYQFDWESRKSTQRVDKPLDWLILERSLAKLSWQMIDYGYGFSIPREQALEILMAQIKAYTRNALWSNKHTAFDLIDQLLSHNLLEMVDDEISFWHASFRDYFAALHLSKLPMQQILEFASISANAPITAYLGGLLLDSRPVVDLLVKKTLEGKNPDEAAWPLQTLAKMGKRFTRDIIRAISVPSFSEVHFAAYSILDQRNFKGEEIFWDTFNLLTTIEEYDMGWTSWEDVSEGMPNPDSINFNVFNSFYEKILLAISNEEVDDAKKHYAGLILYLGSLPQEDAELDTWLTKRGLDDYNEFTRQLQFSEISLPELLEFCRNTVLRSSLPYLEFITSNTDNFKLRMEANLAIQSIIRR